MSARPSGTQEEGPPEALPEDLYGSWSGSPSPDGRVAFVSDRSGEPWVWLCGPGGELTMIEAAPSRVSYVSWSPDGRWLACVAAAADSSRTHVWVMRPELGDLRLLAGAGSVTAEIGGGPFHGWAADGRVLVTETDGRGPSVCVLVDPGTGDRDLVAQGALFRLLDVDAGARRALLRVGPRGARSLAVVDLGGHAKGVVRRVDLGPGPGGTERGCLSRDGATVYARTDVGRAFAALVAVDVGGNLGVDRPEPVVLAHRDGIELDDVVLSPDGGSAALLWNVYGGRSALGLLILGGVGASAEAASAAVSVAAAAASDTLVDLLPRDVVDECRFSVDGAALLVTAEDWADPRGVWTLDLAAGRARSLSSPADGPRLASRGATTAEVDAADLTRPQLRRVHSGDGLEFSGWLYRPPGPPPWPTMIHLHGGPEAQERPVYNSLFQSLVAAGVAVFAPNVRGSSGFGRAFVAADDRELRYGAIADVAASVDHLVTSGVADAGRVGCMGRSYGGWLTLAALVWHPELFAAGVAVCGMSDFETFFADTEPWIAAAAIGEYGDPVADAALLADLSPLRRMKQLRAPLLLVHGDRDTNVPVMESRRVVAALSPLGAVHRYLEFEGEGHELLATPNRVAFVQTTVGWAVEHLAAEVQSIGSV